jgi:transcriptional regulator with XRE-family HTH domain
MTSTATRTTADPLAERHWICARRLRERRRALGLTQADVVTRMGDSGAGLTNRTVSAMENGRGLDLGRLPELAAALDCTITYLVGLTADPARWEPDTPLAGHDDPPGAGNGTPADVGPSHRANPEPGVDASGDRPAGHRNWILGPDPPSWSRPH